MLRTARLLGCGGMLALTGTLATLAAQQPVAPAIPAQPASGPGVFAKYCSSCHGQEGMGARATALADSQRLGAMSASEIANVIRNGTPNGMPPFNLLSNAELDGVTAYLRSLNPPVAHEVVMGDAAAGERYFFGSGKCGGCHTARGVGTAIGPDLSNIGRQLTPTELTRALVEPSATIAPNYAMASAQLKDGTTVRGFVRNEGNYTMPLQDLAGRLVVVDKRTAKVVREPGSIMPQLKATTDETRDLIAFLSGMRGSAGSSGSLRFEEPSARARREAAER